MMQCKIYPTINKSLLNKSTTSSTSNQCNCKTDLPETGLMSSFSFFHSSVTLEDVIEDVDKIGAFGGSEKS